MGFWSASTRTVCLRYIVCLRPGPGSPGHVVAVLREAMWCVKCVTSVPGAVSWGPGWVPSLLPVQVGTGRGPFSTLPLPGAGMDRESPGCPVGPRTNPSPPEDGRDVRTGSHPSHSCATVSQVNECGPGPPEGGVAGGEGPRTRPCLCPHTAGSVGVRPWCRVPQQRPDLTPGCLSSPPCPGQGCGPSEEELDRQAARCSPQSWPPGLPLSSRLFKHFFPKYLYSLSFLKNCVRMQGA